METAAGNCYKIDEWAASIGGIRRQQKASEPRKSDLKNEPHEENNGIMITDYGNSDLPYIENY